MKRILNKKSDGAASIIVVFMIMVLFVFGMLSLTTGIANLRLSRKGATWNTEYYALEKTAEEYLFDLDALLLEAEQKARAAATSINPPQSPSAELYGDAFVRYYYYYACEALATLNDAHVDEAVLDKEQYINMAVPVNDMPRPLIYLDFGEEESIKHLLVGVQAVCPAYDFSYSGGTFSGTRTNATDYRFTVIEWREWQQPFDYNQSEEFWDGQISIDE